MVKKVARKMFVKLTSDDISKNQYGKRDEVEFSKVDKRSWRANLGWNWRSCSRSTENDLGLIVNIEDHALCQISHLLTINTGLFA